MDDELEIKAYYAGHVLGAAMVLIKVGSESVVYTVSATRLVYNVMFIYSSINQHRIVHQSDVYQTFGNFQLVGFYQNTHASLNKSAFPKRCSSVRFTKTFTHSILND